MASEQGHDGLQIGLSNRAWLGAGLFRRQAVSFLGMKPEALLSQGFEHASGQGLLNATWSVLRGVYCFCLKWNPS